MVDVVSFGSKKRRGPARPLKRRYAPKRFKRFMGRMFGTFMKYAFRRASKDPYTWNQK